MIRALQRLGLADVYGECDIPLYVLNVTYPLIDDEFLTFSGKLDCVLVVEEGYPEYIEQAFRAMLHKAGRDTKLAGKGIFPMAGEITGEIMLESITSFLRENAPQLLPAKTRAPNREIEAADIQDLVRTVPPRPPGFCTGCPERPIFAAMKLIEEKHGSHQIACDIGCHLFSTMPPFELGGTTMGFGLGPASNAAFDGGGSKRPVSFMGDGGFWHNGLSSSIGNAVYNRSDGVIIIVDNFYSAATGGQDVLSSRADNTSKSTNHPIKKAIKGVGVEWVRQIDDTYNVTHMRDTIEEALTTKHQGPKVIIAASECMLNRQRRERPLLNKAIEKGERVVKPRFGVDEDICTGDHACMRLSGCPSLTIKTLDDPLRDDPVAYIDQTCVGCGNCGEVADAAVLCPSFYKAEIIHNPTGLEQWVTRQRLRFINWLQAKRAGSRLNFEGTRS
jgi:indolepyruvate ferredoxin oxidoreductase alpha subunit